MRNYSGWEIHLLTEVSLVGSEERIPSKIINPQKPTIIVNMRNTEQVNNEDFLFVDRILAGIGGTGFLGKSLRQYLQTIASSWISSAQNGHFFISQFPLFYRNPAFDAAIHSS